MDVTTAAIAALRAAGWRFEPPAVPRTRRSEGTGPAPVDAVHWGSAFSRLSSPDDAVWFLALEDYAGAPASAAEAADDGFAWNAFERLSLDAAAGDPDRAAIRAFWGRHLPILLSVRGPYAYLALRDDGVVVYGEEPEFEETEEVAPDLGALLREISDPPRDHASRVARLLLRA